MNKAVYTVSSVQCFWAGAILRPYTLQLALAVALLIASSVLIWLVFVRAGWTDQRMDRRTDRWTDRPT